MRILDKIRKVFKINQSIYWQDFDRRRICGHIGDPKIGDVITTKMQSGNIGVFEITKVDWCMDPKNMYFADVKDVGYWFNPTKATAQQAGDK